MSTTPGIKSSSIARRSHSLRASRVWGGGGNLERLGLPCRGALRGEELSGSGMLMQPLSFFLLEGYSKGRTEILSKVRQGAPEKARESSDEGPRKTPGPTFSSQGAALQWKLCFFSGSARAGFRVPRFFFLFVLSGDNI